MIQSQVQEGWYRLPVVLRPQDLGVVETRRLVEVDRVRVLEECLPLLAGLLGVEAGGVEPAGGVEGLRVDDADALATLLGEDLGGDHDSLLGVKAAATPQFLGQQLWATTAPPIGEKKEGNQFLVICLSSIGCSAERG